MAPSRLAARLVAFTFCMATIAALEQPARAQTGAAPLSSAARAEVVQKLAEQMQQRFVFADVGRRVADDLRAQAAAGVFEKAATTVDFAKQLTTWLQTQTQDKHLRVFPARPGGVAGMLGSAEASKVNFGFERLQRLPGNIGYLDLRFFTGDRDAKDVAVATMNWLAHTDALIVDLRRNGGGDPEMIRFIQSYLFDQPTLLNTLHWRDDKAAGGFRIDEFRTSDQVQGRRYGGKKPVWVLTSHYTFSGGEEFTYNLQALKRGTIVGESTGGGAHPGGRFDLGHGLQVHLSTGRAMNPLTGKNWEGTGVAPDIAVPADEALRRAQLEILRPMLASETPGPRRSALEARLKSLEEGKAEF
jgi:retinol-binding protein 3